MTSYLTDERLLEARQLTLGGGGIIGGFVFKANGKPIWVWNEQLNRYQRFDESGRKGRIISHREMVALRDEWMDHNKGRMEKIVREMWERDITLAQFEERFKVDLVRIWTDQYALARGGMNALTGHDKEEIARLVNEQYVYLDRYLDQIEGGQFTEQQLGYLITRSNLYVESSGEAYELGRMAAMDLPTDSLPIWPKSGDTLCKMNCRCWLDISQGDTGWEVVWNLGEADHCIDCLAQSEDWAPGSPFIVPYPPNHWKLVAKQPQRGRGKRPKLQLVV